MGGGGGGGGERERERERGREGGRKPPFAHHQTHSVPTFCQKLQSTHLLK